MLGVLITIGIVWIVLKLAMFLLKLPFRIIGFLFKLPGSVIFWLVLIVLIFYAIG